jgi:hypothetical protein
MSNEKTTNAPEANDSMTVDRRGWLSQVALGGLALAALGGGAADAAEPASGECAVMQPIMSNKIRRVVTTVNADGKSTVLSDEMVDAGAKLWEITADQPLGPGKAGEPAYTKLMTGRVGVETIRPSQEPKPTHENRKGFHVTPGVTHILVMNGPLTYLTDLGEVKLNAGDLVIQRNSSHAWRNDGQEAVKIFVALNQ